MRKSVRNHLTRESTKPLDSLFNKIEAEEVDETQQFRKIRKEKEIFKNIYFENDYSLLERRNMTLKNELNEGRELIASLESLQNNLFQKFNNMMDPEDKII
jgi:hypothetical protein